MRITNSVVFGASKGCIYKQIKPPLVGEHAFPLTGFVCKENRYISCLPLIETVGYSKMSTYPLLKQFQNVAFAILYAKDTAFDNIRNIVLPQNQFSDP